MDILLLNMVFPHMLVFFLCLTSYPKNYIDKPRTTKVKASGKPSQKRARSESESTSKQVNKPKKIKSEHSEEKPKEAKPKQVKKEQREDKKAVTDIHVSSKEVVILKP